MTFQPTAWILVFATLFVGFFEQGCGPNDGGGSSASSDNNDNKPDDGTTQPERVDDTTPEATGEDVMQKSRVSGDALGQWVSGILVDCDDKLQLVEGNVSKRVCEWECARWPKCTGIEWKNATRQGECRLCNADKVAARAKDADKDDEAGQIRRRILYGNSVAEAVEAVGEVFIVPRCGHLHANMILATVADKKLSLQRQNGSDDDEFTALACKEACISPNCTVGTATTAQKEEAPGAYGGVKITHSTQCEHRKINDVYLKAVIANSTESDEFQSITIASWRGCTEDVVDNFAFLGVYDSTVGTTPHGVVETTAECWQKCDGNCTFATFVDTKSASYCFTTTNKTTRLVDMSAPDDFNQAVAGYTYTGYKRLYVPDFEARKDAGNRFATSNGPAVGAIIGGALAAVAVAVLAFVGFRAYKKHKGADAENTDETGSVATSSPKSARKRQAIE